MRKNKQRENRQREGNVGVSPLVEALQAASCVARDDRDGRSRYRASKMSAQRIN